MIIRPYIYMLLVDEILDSFLQFRLCGCPDHLSGLCVGLEEEDGGDALNVKASADVLRPVNIHFVDDQLTFVLGSQFFGDGF